MKKKIIFVTEALWIGGIETALINLLNQFDYDKYDVTLLILQAKLNMVEHVNSKCHLLIADREKAYSFETPYRYKRLYHLTEEATHPSTIHKILMNVVPAIKWIENRLYISYIRKMMKDKYYDVAIIYSDVVAEISVRAIKANKYIMFYHHGAMRHVYHDKVAYEKCDKIIAVSENQTRELKEFSPKYVDKIDTIHNVIDIEGIRVKSLYPMEDNFDQSKFNIVSVGRIAYEKGMDIAVHACAKLVEAGIDNICWWIVGEGPRTDDLKKIIVELHMENYVYLVGVKKNPYPYIRQADLYVQTSRVESFGMTIKEALVLGKPIISTRTAGGQELIIDGINGSCCDVSSASVAEAIKFLYKNSKEVDRYCKFLKVIDFEEENKNSMLKLYDLLERE